MRAFNLGHSEILEWPMSQAGLDNLGQTRLVSPRVGNAHGYESCGHDQYVQEVEELPALRDLVEAGKWPREYLEKYIGSGELSPVLKATLGSNLNDPRNAADTVRMDYPFDIWDLVIEPWAFSNQIPFKVLPQHQGVPFVEAALNRAKAHSIIADALNKSFDVKYALGGCRPTEYYDCSVQRYRTPNHPEMPAGHGAFSGAGARAFELIFDPSPEQLEEVIFATQQFAMFRSFSAMHIPYSNLLGWKIGYESV